MTTLKKSERQKEIREQVKRFCELHLDEELTDFALKLCDKLAKKRTLDIGRGNVEIWAASIVYVIARLNFLFDKENEYVLEADTICDFFGTKKSTTGNKATVIEKACNLGIGAEGFCRADIVDMMTLVELDNGMVIPKNMLPSIAVAFAEGEDAEELKRFMAEEKNRLDEERLKREEKRAERSRKAAEGRRKQAEEKRKKMSKNQFDLFGDNN